MRENPPQVELQFPAGKLADYGLDGFTSIANYVWSKSSTTPAHGEDFEAQTQAQPNDSTRPYLADRLQTFTCRKGYLALGYNGAKPQRRQHAAPERMAWGFDSTVRSRAAAFQMNYNSKTTSAEAGRG